MSSERQLEEKLLTVSFEIDMEIRVVRHVTNVVIVSSAQAGYSVKIGFQSNVERDVATVVLRSLTGKYKEDPAGVKEEADR